MDRARAGVSGGAGGGSPVGAPSEEVGGACDGSGHASTAAASAASVLLYRVGAAAVCNAALCCTSVFIPCSAPVRIAGRYAALSESE